MNSEKWFKMCKKVGYKVLDLGDRFEASEDGVKMGEYRKETGKWSFTGKMGR